MPENLSIWHASLSAHRVRQSESLPWAVDTVGLVALTGQAKLCSGALFGAAGRYQDAMLVPAAERLMGPDGIHAPGAWDAIGAVGGLLGAGVLLAGQLSVSVGWFVLYGAAELCFYIVTQLWDQIHQDPPPPAPLRRDRPATPEAVSSSERTIPKREPGPAAPGKAPSEASGSAADAARPASHRQLEGHHASLKQSMKLVGKLARRLEALENKQEATRHAAAAWADMARSKSVELSADMYLTWVRDLLDAEVANLSTKYHAVSNVACGAGSETRQIAKRMRAAPHECETLSPVQMAPMRQLFHEAKRSLATAKSDLDALDAHFNRAQSAMMAFQRFLSRDFLQRPQLPFRMENMMGAGYVVAKTHGELFAIRRATHTYFMTTSRLFHTTIPNAIVNLTHLQKDTGQIVRQARASHFSISMGVAGLSIKDGGTGRGDAISSPNAQPVPS